jgi:hypothetical protein
MYVLADERDVVRLRTEQRDSDVYIYRTRATPEQSRKLFVDVMRRVNSLKRRPEYYDTLMNNCTTNIVAHVNYLQPGRVPWGLGILLPGYSDRLAYQLGLLVDHGSFEETRRRALVTKRADGQTGSVQFSQMIRGQPSVSKIAERSRGPAR